MAEEISCGKWKPGRVIGRGAYGVVHLAEGPGGERAAVKICRRDATAPERYERELRGARMYRSIPPCEGLVRMRNLVVCDWGFATVMELADGEAGADAASPEYRPKTLASVIAGEKALPLDACLTLAIALAKGLATLQRHHFLHRDIKPANILYVKGRPVLADPGLLVDEAEAASLVGTPGYVPPERFTGAGGDVFSLGLTLKAASFGRPVEELDRGPALEADTNAAGFPQWWRILNKATDPDPARRYRSAKALLKDLKALRRRIMLANAARSRVATAAAGIAAAAAIAALGVANWRTNAEQSKHRETIDWMEKARRDSAEIVKETYRNAQRTVRELEWNNCLADHYLDYDETTMQIAMSGDTDSVADAAGRKRRMELLERMKEIVLRRKAILQDVEALWKKAQEKMSRGEDDESEFEAAKTLDAEKNRLRMEMDALRQERKVLVSSRKGSK